MLFQRHWLYVCFLVLVKELVVTLKALSGQDQATEIMPASTLTHAGLSPSSRDSFDGAANLELHL